MSTVKSWREICPLRDEVKKGELKAADFAADLNNAHRGTGPKIYTDPVAFFSRNGMRVMPSKTWSLMSCSVWQAKAVPRLPGFTSRMAAARHTALLRCGI